MTNIHWNAFQVDELFHVFMNLPESPFREDLRIYLENKGFLLLDYHTQELEVARDVLKTKGTIFEDIAKILNQEILRRSECKRLFQSRYKDERSRPVQSNLDKDGLRVSGDG